MWDIHFFPGTLLIIFPFFIQRECRNAKEMAVKQLMVKARTQLTSKAIRFRFTIRQYINHFDGNDILTFLIVGRIKQFMVWQLKWQYLSCKKTFIPTDPNWGLLDSFFFWVYFSLFTAFIFDVRTRVCEVINRCVAWSFCLGTHRKEGREPSGGSGKFFSYVRREGGRLEMPFPIFSKGKCRKSKHEQTLTIQ